MSGICHSDPCSGNLPDAKRRHGPSESLRRTGFSMIHTPPAAVMARAASHVRRTRMLATLTLACSHSLRFGRPRMCCAVRSGRMLRIRRNRLTVNVEHGMAKRPFVLPFLKAAMSTLNTALDRRLSFASSLVSRYTQLPPLIAAHRALTPVSVRLVPENQ
jgi:hypothetical protein